MRRALHAEWTKLRTVPSTSWLLLGTIAATAGIGAAVAGAIHLPACRLGLACQVDTTRLALYGTRAGQVTVAVLAVLAVTGEYATGLVHLTLAATPRRYQAFGAKVAATVIAATGTGIAAAGAAVALSGWIFAARGYTASRGYGSSLTDPATMRAVVGTVIYFGLVALLAAGIAAAIRSGAAALSSVLALLFAFPLAAALITEPTWRRHLHQWSPADAGLNIQATTGLAHLPLRPWTGLAVLAAWAAAAAILGALAFRYRDA
jgi:ABC-2 type transport system permease protein